MKHSFVNPATAIQRREHFGHRRVPGMGRQVAIALAVVHEGSADQTPGGRSTEAETIAECAWFERGGSSSRFSPASRPWRDAGGCRAVRRDGVPRHRALARNRCANGSRRDTAGLLFGVTATDLATHLVVFAVLGTGPLLASCLPARRATGIDPMVGPRE